MSIAGCCSFVAKSGDAKIFSCYQLIHSSGSKYYRMKLPIVSIGEASTTVIHIRDMPPELEGQFRYHVSLLTHSMEMGRWNDTKISVVWKNLEGRELRREKLVLYAATEGFSPNFRDSEKNWLLDFDHSLPVQGTSFDIFITVEVPSERKTDRIALSGFAITHPEKPKDTF